MKNLSTIPLRVLMTADTVGGVWTYALDLAGFLSGYGVETAVATMGETPSPRQREEAWRVPGLRLFESGYKLEWMEDPWADVREAGEWLLEVERETRPDIVHLNGYAHGALPWKAPRMIVAHSCVLSWWRAVKGEPAPAAWDRYREEAARGLSAADLVAAPSGAMLRAARENYGAFPRERVIYNARDPRRFRRAPKEKFALTAGRFWDPAKNLSLVRRAAPRIPWPVYAAGETCFGAHSGGETEGLRPLGRLSPAALAEWYSRAAIFVLPVRYEPFGLSALEAALSGCALVLGDIPSQREIWGEAALFCSPDDPAALAEAVNGLIEDPGRREELSAKARERALRYEPRRMAAEYFTCYRDLLERQASRKAARPAAASAGAAPGM